MKYKCNIRELKTSLNKEILTVLRSCHFFGRLRLQVAKVPEPTPAPTYLGRLRLQAKKGGSRRLRLRNTGNDIPLTKKLVITVSTVVTGTLQAAWTWLHLSQLNPSVSFGLSRQILRWIWRLRLHHSSFGGLAEKAGYVLLSFRHFVTGTESNIWKN